MHNVMMIMSNLDATLIISPPLPSLTYPKLAAEVVSMDASDGQVLCAEDPGPRDSLVRLALTWGQKEVQVQ